MTERSTTTTPMARRTRPRAAARVRLRLFGISPNEADFERRRFPALESPERPRFEAVGRTFIGGYLVGLEVAAIAELPARLDEVEASMQGFAYEGAAMALCIRDLVAAWRPARLPDYFAGIGNAHIYMAHVGAGWGFARVRWRMRAGLRHLDPLLGSLAMDGYGFHEGYFHWRRSFEDGLRPRRLQGYSLRAFDQGLGRALWFVEGAEPAEVISRVRRLPRERHPDLWSGLGLAVAYAGGADSSALAELTIAAGEMAPNLAQGAAFAARARQRAGNLTPHTDAACLSLCGRPAEAAADLCEAVLADLDSPPGEAAYEQWRLGVQARLSTGGGA